MGDRVGQQLGNYRLLRLLGRGGFAEVYLGEHIHLKTQAAIKVLHTQLTQQEQQDFLREARIIAHLEHPNIVRLLEYGIENNVPFLVMSYAPNGTVRQHCPRKVSLPLPLIISFAKQLASALQYAHDEHIIHRDIKPENMLIGRHNQLLLSDFGIALVAHSEQSLSTQNVIGTPAYMAPEQFVGKSRPASDQYSLGIVVYEWLCGERPFTQGDLGFQHNYTSPPSLQQKSPDIPLEIEQVVMKALAKEPHQRFASIQEFAMMLETAYRASLPSSSQGQEDILFSSIMVPSQNRPQSKIRKVLVPVLLLILSLALIGISVFSLPLSQFRQLPTPTGTITPSVIPPLPTACPSQGTGRKATMPSLTIADNHQYIIFVENKDKSNDSVKHSQSSMLMRYDTITGAKSTIINIQTSGDLNGQIHLSRNGQWILFVSSEKSRDKIQLIRVDGQGLQTLYCSPVPSALDKPISLLDYVEWSSYSNMIAFSQIVESEKVLGRIGVLSLLNLDTGKYSEQMKTEDVEYLPVHWVEDVGVKELYVESIYLGPTTKMSYPTVDIYRIDFQPTMNNDLPFSSQGQPEKVVTGLLQPWSYDISPDGYNLFYCQATKTQSEPTQEVGGPSSIENTSLLYGPGAPIYKNDTDAVVWIHAISDKMILFLIKNAAGLDSSQDGLWKVNTNGTGLVRLASDGISSFQPSSHNSWSVVSRDNTMYAFFSKPNDTTEAIVSGSLNGGKLTTVYTSLQNSSLYLVGWARL